MVVEYECKVFVVCVGIVDYEIEDCYVDEV